MYGTMTGNLAATMYYVYFQLAGLAFVFLLFRRESLLSRLLMGSVAGSLLVTWLPILSAFVLDFTLAAHLLALFLTLPMFVVAVGKLYSQHRPLPSLRQLSAGVIRHGAFLVCFFCMMILWGYLLHTHTLLPMENGSLHTGQCTYGDMNMHLGFITSLARQAAFPPDYSILPGTRLSYPFLSDSVSSSPLLFGASLRYAYILPMLFAMAQIFTAVYLFAGTVSDSPRRKAGSAALLALLLFFLNGGLGFTYFTDWGGESPYRFSDIFTGFYTTPTNLVDQNIRWVNLIADMLLPQRATLFGYAVLFPALWMLYRAVFQNRRDLFLPAGLSAAALPMIHTHSFLSIGIISAVWMLLWLYRNLYPSPGKKSSPLGRIFRHPGPWILVLFLLTMCLVQQLHRLGLLSPTALMAMGILPFAAAFLFGLLLLVRYVHKYGPKELLTRWGIYLACILLLALPQLFFWTFGQVSQGGFVRGHFNWGNQGEFYLWFYLKNLGIPLLLITAGVCSCDRKKAPLFLPGLFLWWISELVVFTPNPYDNNKLLYAAYLLLCIGASDCVVAVFRKLLSLTTRSGASALLWMWAVSILFFAVFSALLTLGREIVSDYQLYSASQTALAEYAETQTPPDAVYLTSTRHNNEIASLSGRNIVCGADVFLYFHGLDTTERKSDLRLMYEAPLEHMELFEKYNVDYVVISNYERNDYTVEETSFQTCFEEVFSQGDAVLYRVPSASSQ